MSPSFGFNSFLLLTFESKFTEPFLLFSLLSLNEIFLILVIQLNLFKLFVEVTKLIIIIIIRVCVPIIPRVCVPVVVLLFLRFRLFLCFRLFHLYFNLFLFFLCFSFPVIPVLFLWRLLFFWLFFLFWLFSFLILSFSLFLFAVVCRFLLCSALHGCNCIFTEHTGCFHSFQSLLCLCSFLFLSLRHVSSLLLLTLNLLSLLLGFELFCVFDSL
mmetsp:Transcript_15649/g.15049  ORF Transcript_15649/g.15049 Transcript_15649/m.15049 type:complete len:214 (-) Transcript_15649:501-1142(-)